MGSVQSNPQGKDSGTVRNAATCLGDTHSTNHCAGMLLLLWARETWEELGRARLSLLGQYLRSICFPRIEVGKALNLHAEGMVLLTDMV